LMFNTPKPLEIAVRQSFKADIRFVKKSPRSYFGEFYTCYIAALL